MKAPAEQECFIEAGKPKTLTFENTPLSAIVVWKYDSVTGKAVEGATFQVRYLSGTSGTGGTVIGTYRTSQNGSFTVTGCEAGTYVIEEVASDGSHVIDAPPQTVYISGEAQDICLLYTSSAMAWLPWKLLWMWKKTGCTIILSLTAVSNISTT